MARQTKQQKLDAARIQRAYSSSCSGIQIPILETVAVHKLGEKLIAEGADDAALAAGIRAYVETIQVN